jgi:hypothetical protein
MISVSRLCCPVCGELLAILNENGPQLSFPNCHSTIYPIELPSWLPDGIVEQLTAKFQQHLRNELTIMVKGNLNATKQTKKHHASHESESNISVASTNRDDDDDDEYDEYEAGKAKQQQSRP